MKSQRVRSRLEQRPKPREINFFRQQGVGQRSFGGRGSIKGGCHRRLTAGDFDPVQIRDESVVIAHGQIQRGGVGWVGDGERKPYISGGIDVEHLCAQVSRDDRLASAGGSEDRQAAFGGVADQPEKIGEAGVGSAGGGEFDFITAGIVEVGKDDRVVTGAEGAGDDGISGRAQAVHAHDGGIIDAQSKAFVGIDMERVRAGHGDDEGGGGAHGEIRLVAAMQGGDAVAEATVSTGGSGDIDHRGHRGQERVGAGGIEQCFGGGDGGHGGGGQPLFNEKPRCRHAESEVGRGAGPFRARDKVR